MISANNGAAACVGVVRGIMGGRIDVVIERWGNLDKSTQFRWSIWRDGARVQMGGPHPTAEESEAEAVDYCRRSLGRAPDRVERL